MSVEVKYAVANNSVHTKDPKQATIDSTGYDLFAAKSKTLLPHDVTPIYLELHFEIPDRYFGKIYPRSGLLTKHFVSSDAGVFHSCYQSVVLVLMKNHSKEEFVVKKGCRIVHLVIHKEDNIVFKKNFLQFLEPTERRSNGFGSKGL